MSFNIIYHFLQLYLFIYYQSVKELTRQTSVLLNKELQLEQISSLKSKF